MELKLNNLWYCNPWLTQTYPIMGGGNVDMWHDCMYVHCTLVVT